MILDRPLYLWNKDNKKHLYIEVDSCDEGWGSCTYQYAKDPPIDAEADKETIERLLTLEQTRNLIETQEIGHGVTCYSDHLPGIKNASLSNKGKLLTWRIHETSDLTSIVETLYKSGPTMAIADPLSRLARQKH
jgi:hypothetical protein